MRCQIHVIAYHRTSNCLTIFSNFTPLCEIENNLWKTENTFKIHQNAKGKGTRKNKEKTNDTLHKSKHSPSSFQPRGKNLLWSADYKIVEKITMMRSQIKHSNFILFNLYYLKPVSLCPQCNHLIFTTINAYYYII